MPELELGGPRGRRAGARPEIHSVTQTPNAEQRTPNGGIFEVQGCRPSFAF